MAARTDKRSGKKRHSQSVPPDQQPTVTVVSAGSGGQGEVALKSDLLNDTHRTRSDAKLIAKAVREKWPVSDRNCAEVVGRLMRIVRRRKVNRLTADGGVFADEGAADAHATAAARVLVAMVGQNKTQSPQSPSATTINVGVNVDNSGLDERRSRTLAIAERFRASGVLREPES